jgi:hypothetical protein
MLSSTPFRVACCEFPKIQLVNALVSRTNRAPLGHAHCRRTHGMLNVQSYAGTFTIARIGTLIAALPSRRRQWSLAIRSMSSTNSKCSSCFSLDSNLTGSTYYFHRWVAVARELVRPYRRSEIRISGESNPFSFPFVSSVSSRASCAIDSTTKTCVAPCYICISLHPGRLLSSCHWI